jgi:transcriptional regulator with XRE-family HTH domain
METTVVNYPRLVRDRGELGQALFLYRKKNNLGQEELAKLLGMFDQTQISRAETGRGFPVSRFWLKIAKLLNISVERIAELKRKKHREARCVEAAR